MRRHAIIASMPDGETRVAYPRFPVGRPRAFSLAELMIALVILGLGLLFIAAALPVGLEYTRQTVDLATSDAAADYAIDQLDVVLRTAKNLNDNAISPQANRYHRLDTIERPRDFTDDTSGAIQAFTAPYNVCNSYEPVFKVRPLALGNISMNPLESDPPGRVRGGAIVDDPETLIFRYLWLTVGVLHPGIDLSNASINYLESGIPFGLNMPFQPLSLVRHPVLPGVARVYPPIEPLVTNSGEFGFRVSEFYQGNPSSSYLPYISRTMNAYFDVQKLYAEREKAIDQRVVWTAFYRRISYKANPGTDGQWYNPIPPYANRSRDDVAEAPLLYEIIYVICQRPTVNHRFPLQDVSNTPTIFTFNKPQALAIADGNKDVGADRLAPTPWLVTFTQLPTAGTYLETPGTPGTVSGKTASDRYLPTNVSPPPTLTFTCTREMGYLLPPGSVFIPALNDQCDDTAAAYIYYQRVGFVPSAPETLPIYEVLERIEDHRTPRSTTLIVKNPGYYPWTNPNAINVNSAPNLWPVWVIPPAFERRDFSGQPVFESKSPIIKIVRRTITLPEIQR